MKNCFDDRVSEAFEQSSYVIEEFITESEIERLRSSQFTIALPPHLYAYLSVDKNKNKKELPRVINLERRTRKIRTNGMPWLHVPIEP